MQDTLTSKNFLTVSEAARKLGCHPNTVKRLERRLGIKVKRDYRNYRIYSQDDIQQIRNFIDRIY
jgi:DNA-binding transcriptional MerR regulator